MSIIDIFQIYKIGKELGLSRKEITTNFVFRDRYPLFLAIMLVIILAVFAVLFWNIAIMLYANRPDSIYPSGTLYSTVRLKDFKDKILKLKLK
ncbi:MAG: hypothetical protein ACFFCY_17035 [Promethearchaeota archaeon]